jgi:hypothetical protein
MSTDEITAHIDRDTALALVGSAGFVRDETGARRWRDGDGNVVAYQLDEALLNALVVLAERTR